MTKLRKQRRRKVYRHNVNRKRLRNKLESVGKISCKPVENAWDRRKSMQTNLQEMGLSYDPNKTIKLPKYKGKLKKPSANSIGKEEEEWEVDEFVQSQPSKSFVAEELEKDARAPRAKMFRLPKGQVEWITYLMDKYGKDYQAMAKDKKNYYQETWKQIRAKIKRFKGIPEQYNKFLAERNLTGDENGESDTPSDGEL